MLQQIHKGFLVQTTCAQPGQISFVIRYHGEVIFESPRFFRNPRLALEAGFDEAERQYLALVEWEEADAKAAYLAERPRQLG
jgi:hypothetical protein